MSIDRREFIRRTGAGALAAACASVAGETPDARAARPNVVFVFADQWRAQATGYAGDPNVQTPHLDRLRAESADLVNAVSTCPVCSPYRGSLLTGQYALTHGVFMNDVPLRNEAASIAEAYKAAGYDTAYIGKWHLDGRGRSNFIPRERRQGFDYWKVLECTHNYNQSPYYADAPEKLFWDGYDAIAQTRDAQQYLRDRTGERPFLLMLSWGPPHNPYETAPEEFRRMYDPDALVLRENVPDDAAAWARRDLAGYYAHCSALDACVGDLLRTLDETGLAENTVFVFTSDHGDMLGSQGQMRKQRPYDESIRVPLLLRYPAALGRAGRVIAKPFGTPDIMPTLLGLCDVPIPAGVEGADHAPLLRGEERDGDGAALIACYAPFGEWTRKSGGREYRGVRTRRHTYVRDLDGPWLLYDNEADPFQMRNLADAPSARSIQAELDAMLRQILRERGDAFLPGDRYIQQWGYPTDETGTVPYTP